MPRSSFVLLLAALATTVGCGADVSSVDDTDYTDPPIPADAERDDDAYEPLLPENDGTDADVDDAAVKPDDAFVDAVTPVDVSTQADAVTRIDASTPLDAATRVDAATADRPDAARPDAARADAGPPRCTGSASGQSILWTCTADRRARQRCVSGRVETDACAYGCTPQPSGTNDFCAARPATTLPACAHQALLAWGLHPDASDHLRCAGVPASRVSQTIGNAAASAGTHARDGYAGGQPYSAATDLSVRGLSSAEIRALLGRLANQGFAAWYRWPGHDGWPSSESPHIHAIYVGCHMKDSLRAQVRDWLVGRNGLASHTAYTFTTWTAEQRATIRAVYDRYN